MPGPLSGCSTILRMLIRVLLIVLLISRGRIGHTRVSGQGWHRVLMLGEGYFVMRIDGIGFFSIFDFTILDFTILLLRCMNDDPVDNELIERYLLGKLTDAEVRSFKIRLGADREFARKFRLIST